MGFKEERTKEECREKGLKGFASDQSYESRDQVTRILAFINTTLFFALTCHNFMILEKHPRCRWKIHQERNNTSLYSSISPWLSWQNHQHFFLFFVFIFNIHWLPSLKAIERTWIFSHRNWVQILGLLLTFVWLWASYFVTCKLGDISCIHV